MHSPRLSTAHAFREVSTSSDVETPLLSRLRNILGRRHAATNTGAILHPRRIRLGGPFALSGSIGLLLSIALPAATESAVANGDTRTLNLYNQHTKETISATYRVDGHYDPAVLQKLNWFLRDWRRNEATQMDPRLFDAVWETYREAGATRPIVVVCGYRSPQTNAMLRRRSRAVARHSQHILGKAMDTEMPGMSMEKVREIAMRLEMGGVGFYGDSSFIHIDVGGIRYWPRMSYAQLMSVFPDGKTVLIPKDGKPLPGYEEARAELSASGRAAEVPPSEKGQNFFAWLFNLARGGADEHEDEALAAQQNASERPAVAEAAQAKSVQNNNGETDTGKFEAVADAAPAERVPDEPAHTPLAPMPPPRPTAFLALADAPTPPSRPRFATLALARSIAARTAGEMSLRGAEVIASADAELPTIITHGAGETALARTSDVMRRDPQVLAYAPVAQMEGLRSAVAHRARRSDRASWAAAAAQIAAPRRTQLAKLEREEVLSPTLTGLRQAAHIETAALSQKLAAGYLTRFTAVATNLTTGRFSGPAVVGLRAADRDRLVFVDGSGVLKNRE